VAGDRVCAGDFEGCYRAGLGLEPEHHVGCQQFQQPGEVPVAGGGEERVDGAVLGGQVGVGVGGGLYPAAGPAG